MGASRAQGAMKALQVSLDHLGVLVPKAPKDCRARRVNEVLLERVWWELPGHLGPQGREVSRGGQGPSALVARREKLL